MTRPIIGWESEAPVPDGHRFNDYLHVRDGELHFGGMNLAQLFLKDGNAVEGPSYPGIGNALPCPLEIVYLPKIRERIHGMQATFARAAAALGYDGAFHYAYASKANAAEEVIRTTLSAGAHHEMSSVIDVHIAQQMIRRGLLAPDKMIICNGFKSTGTPYADAIISLRRQHERVIPVVEDFAELPPLLASDLPFDVGLRHKTYGPHADAAEMDTANSRFGFDEVGLWEAARQLTEASNLTLRMYHGMVGSQLADIDEFVGRLKPPIEMYARLRQRYPSLSMFNFGGGMPAPMTLEFDFDFDAFARTLLGVIREICDRHGVPVPDVVGEFGRYTTTEHGAHLFRVINVKENNSRLPWYIIDGSIMTSFPDSWALQEHFIVLPLTHLDRPFRQVQLGGATCDSDDVFPPKTSHSPLYLPVETDELYIGFFGIGAYQEMLGGVRGSKHCVLPEASELVVDQDDAGHYTFDLLAGQTVSEVLTNLGFRD
jgi:arginine decarboxylase